MVKHFNDAPCKGRPLFSPAFKDALRNLLIHVDNGCLSDPSGVSLYERVPGAFWKGLPVLHCLRGTPGVEGVFLQANPVLPGKNVGVRLADALLMLHAFDRNLIERARRRGVRAPAHRQLWRDALLDAARKRQGLPTPVRPGVNVCPPATGETFGGLHLLEAVGADDATLDALDVGDAEDADVLARRLRLRFFGRSDAGAVANVMAPSWASRLAAAVVSAPPVVAAPGPLLSTPAPSPSMDSCSLASLPFPAPSLAFAPAASQPGLSAATPFALQPQRVSSESTPPSAPFPVSSLMRTPLRSTLPPAPPPARSVQAVESALPHLPDGLVHVVASMAHPATSGGVYSDARLSADNSPRAKRARLLMRDYSTAVETLEEHELFLSVLGDNHAPNTPDGWLAFTHAYNARVSASLLALPLNVDPTMRLKRTDALRAHCVALAERLRRARGAAPGASAAAANDALLRRLVTSVANLPHAPISAPSSLVEPPPAVAAAPVWRPAQPTAAPAAGRSAPRPKGCCGHPSDGHPRERERCPNQRDIKLGYPTEGPLPGGRFCTKSEARRNAKRQRLD